MRDAEAFRKAVGDDENVRQLLDRLAFVERFHAVIVKCEMPRVANALVEVLTDELGSLREQMVWVQRWDPYRAHSNLLEPISADLLLDEVLGKLLQAPSESTDSFVLTIVDASRAMPGDDDAWGILFQRMNERRNAIVRAVPGACLILAPRRYDILFAHTAPDFWSIVGAVVDVQTPPIRDEWKGWFVDPILLSEMMNRRLGTTAAFGDAAIINQPLDELPLQLAREFWSKSPQNPLARGYLAIRLLQAARAAQRLGGARAATHLFDEAIEVLESQEKPNLDPRMATNFGLAYSMRASMHISAGRLEEAIDDLNKTVEWAHRATTLESSRQDINDLFVYSLLLRGNVRRLLGKSDAAIADLQEGLRNLLARSESPTVTVDHFIGLADTLSDLGYAYCDQGNFDLALNASDSAMGIIQRVLHEKSDAPGLQGIHENTLWSMIHVQFLRGDFERCFWLAHEGIERTRNLLGSVPDSTERRRTFGMLYVMMAAIQEQRGHRDDAAEYDRLALETLDPLIERSPPDPIAVKLIAAITRDKALPS